ncbi:hypothetical protein [Streptomyces sp. DSM 110735]|uniref:hypothetical protein n=1 Tax=Streptomyces sp. DSM 110735 TaxID=2775031 RepID=UPI0018F72412|nr:hypothetical protein [Streptomyces sp. DSM 110735]MBJ7905138.1 hypothetical protein [Streptomyces sp. DSM 110735]
MCSARLTLCTSLLAAVALAPATLTTTAHAADGGVTVSPAAPAPGSDVSLRVNGCSGSQGSAVSSAFVSAARLIGSGGALTGDTRVRTALQAGAYDVTVTCAGHSFTSRIKVADRAAGDSGQATGPDDPADDSGEEPLTAASPIAPVHAGGGGTAQGVTAQGLAADDLAADGLAADGKSDTLFATVAPTGSGPGAAQALSGLALAGCAAAGVVLLRSRRRRGTD